MAIQNTAPKGLCKLCRRPMMYRVENDMPVWFCPAHGTAAEAASSQVVQGVDASLEGYKKVVNALGFVEAVLISDPRPAATDAQIAAAKGPLKGDEVQGIPAAEPKQSVPPQTVGLLTLRLDMMAVLGSEAEVQVHLTEDQLQGVKDGIEEMEPPKDMKAARALYKLLDQIDALLGHKGE